MQDEDINTFSELQSWVSDATLLKAGTLTDKNYVLGIALVLKLFVITIHQESAPNM